MDGFEPPVTEGSQKLCLVSRCADNYLTAYRLYMNYRCYQTTLQWNVF